MTYRQKTAATTLSVNDYIGAIADEDRRADCRALLELMRAATGMTPKMWGTAIVGFGSYHYRYASGHEGDACLTGFSSRKNDLTLYIMPGFARYEALIGQLGKHKLGKSCLCLKRLADVDAAVLSELVKLSVEDMRRRHA
ncbi:MAG: DUF1801 domain-containing protein [Burkholderiales bacterium]|nr:DUF1801 domain-containing protein [Burkholderiales bacterium]